MAKRWHQVGYIGLDDITPFMGENYDMGAQQQEYAAVQQEYGQEAKQAYVARPPAASAPRVSMPAALTQRMQQVPVEVFDIFPQFPNAVVSSALGAVAAANVETVIHTFTPPTGHYVVINPADITQEVLYQPFNSRGNSNVANFTKGLVSVYTRTGLQGFQQRLYHGGSDFHNPFQNLSSVGNRRRWQVGAVISPGDLMDTRFFDPAIIAGGTTAADSYLDHRVSIKKITP